MVNERHKVVLRKFHELLRSGKDYSVKYMCNEAGKEVYIEGKSAIRIIHRHYKKAITNEMVDYVRSLDCLRDEEIEKFSKQFSVCRRESILIIRYIRRRKNGKAKIS